MNLTELTTITDTVNAHLLRTKLEANGIPCFLHNENITQLMPHYFGLLGSGVKIMVPEDQLEQAREIANIEKEKLRCPNCHSKDLVHTFKTKSFLYLITYAMAIIGLIPFGNLIAKFTCMDCKTTFVNSVVH